MTIELTSNLEGASTGESARESKTPLWPLDGGQAPHGGGNIAPFPDPANRCAGEILVWEMTYSHLAIHAERIFFNRDYIPLRKDRKDGFRRDHLGGMGAAGAGQKK